MNRAHTITCWLCAVALVIGWLTLAAHFDAKRFEGDIRHFQDPEVQIRKQHAAAKICGFNGAPRWIDDTTLECSLHTGRGKPRITTGVLQ